MDKSVILIAVLVVLLVAGVYYIYTQEDCACPSCPAQKACPACNHDGYILEKDCPAGSGDIPSSPPVVRGVFQLADSTETADVITYDGFVFAVWHEGTIYALDTKNKTWENLKANWNKGTYDGNDKGEYVFKTSTKEGKEVSINVSYKSFDGKPL